MHKNEVNSFSFNLEHKKDAAEWLISAAGKKLIWCFYGEMGAGKTTLIGDICRQLGVQSEISSPTFSIVNEYSLADGRKLFHFDFYRINHLEEVYDIGIETYFESGAICLIEWPEKIEELLENEDCFNVKISKIDNGRIIHLGS